MTGEHRSDAEPAAGEHPSDAEPAAGGRRFDAEPLTNERRFDGEAGPVVRPYTMTRGRTRASGTPFDLLTPIMATGAPRRGLPAEYASILDACRAPLPVVELAGRTGLAVGVLKVLLGDLRENGLITVPSPAASSAISHEYLLRDLLAGLRAL